ncbi:O-phosphoseryl-tRNA(Sec) selenium transferase [Candidatus Bathyarchaeota archaeon]|nr:MAG: O-phosphoseryl-tRNA(Sec) selenium transferase [Candidatus Bathyarchaeota archaeon]
MIDIEELLKNEIPKHMLKRASVTLRAKLKPIRLLIEHRRVPEKGWDDDVIEFFLTLLSWMDTDKDPEGAQVGEREARVASQLVYNLAHGFCHGVGRSGNLTAPQPKAVGSSLAYLLTNRLALDMLQRCGAPNLNSTCVLPLATGMAIGLSVSVARSESKKHVVIYPRVDHKSPLKGMQLAGMNVKTVEPEVDGDAVRTSMKKVRKAIDAKTAAIVSTTTFFPPREPDDVKAIAKLAAEEGIFHIINNAYGVQSRQIMKLIQGAIDAGRVDLIIQSTDKNFLTPVGGTILASPSPRLIEKVSQAYAGRGSAAPIIQFLAALLSLGLDGYERLRNEQEINRQMLEEHVKRVADKHGERLLDVFNPIAVAMTLNQHEAKKVGHYMYTLRVTGPRVLEETDFGICCRRYHSPYITVNAAIGSTKEDIQSATSALEKALRHTRKYA